MRIARVLLSSATLLTAACASAAPNKPGADLMGPLLSAAAELRQTDWSSLSTETSLALLRKHFGETSIRVTRPGPTEDAGSVAWEGAVSDGTCTWCVVLLESKPSEGSKVERANLFLSGESQEQALERLDRLARTLSPDLCEGTLLKDLAAQVRASRRGRVTCWPKPEAARREGADVSFYAVEGRWVALVSYWRR